MVCSLLEKLCRGCAESARAYDLEPFFRYIPIIPMVLVNGAEGIGTGWSTSIPNYNPRDIVENIKRLLNGEEQAPMKPWYKGFKGTIEEVTYHLQRTAPGWLDHPSHTLCFP